MHSQRLERSYPNVWDEESYKEQTLDRKFGALTGRKGRFLLRWEGAFQNGESRECKNKKEEGEELSNCLKNVKLAHWKSFSQEGTVAGG